MKLFLEDISKGLDQSSGAKESPSEDQAIESYENSFKRRPGGTAAGEAVDTQDEGGDTEEETSKSAGTDILKGLSDSLSHIKRMNQPDPLEEEFLLSKGFTLRDIQNPSFRVNSRIRSEFNEWLCSRLVLDPQEILGGR